MVSLLSFLFLIVVVIILQILKVFFAEAAVCLIGCCVCGKAVEVTQRAGFMSG